MVGAQYPIKGRYRQGFGDKLMFQVERSPDVAPRTPYIIISNHQSLFDIPIVMAHLFTNYPKFVSKRQLARWIPSVSYNLRRGGNALIDRDNRRQAVRAIRALGEMAQEMGVSAVIYPEGTLARRGEMRPFKPAGALALLDAAPALAVVPMAIDESWRLLRYNLFPVPFGVRVRVYFGAPIPRKGAGDGGLQAIEIGLLQKRVPLFDFALHSAPVVVALGDRVIVPPERKRLDLVQNLSNSSARARGKSGKRLRSRS